MNHKKSGVDIYRTGHIYVINGQLFYKYVFTQVITLFQLLEQGKVKSLDDPLTDYCPAFSIMNPFNFKDKDVVTLRYKQVKNVSYIYNYS